MLRALWSGVITLGLVNVPVRAYKATRPHDLKSNQLHATDHGRVTIRRLCAECGDELEWGDLVNGYPAGGDQYVVVTAEDRAQLAPGLEKGFRLERFCDAAALDPQLIESTYLLAPDKGGTNSYALLLAAMRDTAVIGIGRMLMRDRTYLAAVRPCGEALALSTLHYADEILRPADLEPLRDFAPTLDADHLAAARQLIALHSGPFEHEAYRDDHHDRLQAFIEERAAAAVVVAPRAKGEGRGAKGQSAGDLMAALEASIAAAAPPAPSRRRKRGPQPVQSAPVVQAKPLRQRLATAPHQGELVAAGAHAGEMDA